MMAKIAEELIKALPKAELHCHLDGSLRPSTILELAQEQNVKLPANTPEELKKILVAPPTCNSLEEYLQPFDITVSVLQTAGALERATYELAEDCAAENIRYLEIRFAPVLHLQKGLSLVDVVQAVLRGKQRAERAFDIRIGIIICSIRHNNPEESLKAAELTVAFKNKGIVGFDLAGAEDGFPAKHHREAFDLIINNNINATVHAGEAYGPESIHQALHLVKANRIGHGTRLRENGDLMNYMNDHRIPIEMCITSNVQTKAVRSLDDHPVRFYYDYGLRITLNTDNRLISNTTLTHEYMLAVEHFGFTEKDLIVLVINGFKSAFLSHTEKVEMINRALDEMTDLGLPIRREYI
ncbi:MAG: adenosine deaminase [Bacteroidales bacterium]|nr:adenosine deaminase [Bacteroidales bacterium]NPV37091.1 adenosine deaminase [Bacteroidales bacterium]